MRPEEVDALDMDTFLVRAAQAEYALTHLRGIPNIRIDALLGVPREILEAEDRERATQNAKLAAEMKKQDKIVRMQQRKEKGMGRDALERFGLKGQGEKGKGPIDPQQAKEFMHEVNRSRWEVMAGDMLGIPSEMKEEVDFSFPEEVFEPGSGR